MAGNSNQQLARARRAVLITQRLIEEPRYKELREALDVHWGELITAAGFIPIPISCRIDIEELLLVTQPCGILFSGGNDLGCVADFSPNHERDNLEGRLLALAKVQGIPVLGVCRGMQFIWHYFKGELKEVSSHIAVEHPVNFSSAWMREIYGANETLNSYHRYAATGRAEGLQVIATSEDGVTEAVSSIDRRTVGIMWHPERRSPFAEADIALLRTVFSDSLSRGNS